MEDIPESINCSHATPVLPFAYTPLPDAAHFIRLLCRVPGTLEEDTLVFEMSEHHIDNAPPYQAISYVWGTSNDRHRIIVNDRWIEVNPNALSALHQTCALCRIFGRDGQDETSTWFFWMDTLSINQGDPHEKGEQVEMMADIYRNSEIVIACIGPHQDSSELLLPVFEAISDTESYNFAIRPPQTHSDWVFDDEYDASIAVEWLLSQDEEYFATICEAFARLANRPYWSRMWIVQEIYMGSSVEVMCGDSAFNLNDLMLLETAVERSLDAAMPISWRFVLEAAWAHLSEGYMSRAISHNRFVRGSFGSSIHRMKDFKCYDPRDRVYALNAIIDWGADQPGLKPNYQKSAFDVLLQALEHVNVSEGDSGSPYREGDLSALVQYDVLEALGIGTTSPQVRSGALDRQRLFPDVHSVGLKKEPHLLRQWSYAVSKLSVDRQHRLSVAFHQVKFELTDETQELLDHLESVEGDHGNFGGIFQHRLPQRLFAGSEVAGLVCNGAQSGDSLFPIDVDQAIFEKDSQLYVVLRHCPDSAEGCCVIVGQALIFEHYEPDVRFPTWDQYRGPEYAHRPVSTSLMFEMALTAEDLVILLGQDFVNAGEPDPKFLTNWHGRGMRPRPSKFDSARRFERLVTAVAILPACGARVVIKPSDVETEAAARVACKLAQITTSYSEEHIPERQDILISETRTGLVPITNVLTTRLFAGPFYHVPGDECPIHGPEVRLEEGDHRRILEPDPRAMRLVECICGRSAENVRQGR